MGSDKEDSDWDFLIVGEDFDKVEDERIEQEWRIDAKTEDRPGDVDIIFSSSPPKQGQTAIKLYSRRSQSKPFRSTTTIISASKENDNLELGGRLGVSRVDDEPTIEIRIRHAPHSRLDPYMGKFYDIYLDGKKYGTAWYNVTELYFYIKAEGHTYGIAHDYNEKLGGWLGRRWAEGKGDSWIPGGKWKPLKSLGQRIMTEVAKTTFSGTRYLMSEEQWVSATGDKEVKK